MALQGTLDTFGLPDVLRLVESTGKSGALRVISDSLLGTVWIDNGTVVASETSVGVPAGEHAAALFQLLCLIDGEFEFINGEVPAKQHRPMPLSDLVKEAEEQLLEWQDIQEVIPSLDTSLKLVAELSTDEILLDSQQWKLIVAVGTGSMVATLGDKLSISQVPLGRQLKALVEAGVLEVVAAGTEIVPPVTSKATQSDLKSDASDKDIESSEELLEVVAEGEVADPEAADLSSRSPVADGLDAVDRLKARIEAVKGVTDSDQDEDADASIASLTGDTVEFETEPAAGLFPADAEPGADDINRGTLLKFLSSVRS